MTNLYLFHMLLKTFFLLEMYLQKHNLIQISTGGRSLTKEGRDYLKENLNTKA